MKEPKVIEESVYTVMAGLSVDEKLVVCLPLWDKVRTYAYQFKKQMDREYTVHRMRSDHGVKLDYLLVERKR